jgi:hypothetical protein
MSVAGTTAYSEMQSTWRIPLITSDTKYTASPPASNFSIKHVSTQTVTTVIMQLLSIVIYGLLNDSVSSSYSIALALMLG